MTKRVYKKRQKVAEIVIYRRTDKHKKLSFSTFLSFAIILLVSSLLYYLNNSGNFTHLLFLQKQAGNKQKVQIKNNYLFPLPLNLQSYLLHKKKHNLALGKEQSLYHDPSTSTQDQIIWHGPRDTKAVALTFDADMTPVMVDWLHSGQVATYDDTRITDYLIQNRIKATFFLTGLWIESYPGVTKALAENSLFELENHSYSHPSMAGNCFDQPQIPPSQYPYEIEKTQQLIEQYTHHAPKYFRFPGGCYDQADLNLVKKEGLRTVHWDDVADDGFNTNEEQVINNVLSEARNGSIIVMHMGGKPNIPVTAAALPIIVDGLKKKGFTFVTVSQLLNSSALATKLDPKKYLSDLESFSTVIP